MGMFDVWDSRCIQSTVQTCPNFFKKIENAKCNFEKCKKAFQQLWKCIIYSITSANSNHPFELVGHCIGKIHHVIHQEPIHSTLSHQVEHSLHHPHQVHWLPVDHRYWVTLLFFCLPLLLTTSFTSLMPSSAVVMVTFMKLSAVFLCPSLFYVHLFFMFFSVVILNDYLVSDSRWPGLFGLLNSSSHFAEYIVVHLTHIQISLFSKSHIAFSIFHIGHISAIPESCVCKYFSQFDIVCKSSHSPCAIPVVSMIYHL